MESEDKIYQVVVNNVSYNFSDVIDIADLVNVVLKDVVKELSLPLTIFVKELT